MINEKKLENWLKNFVLGSAVEKALIQGPLYTSKSVWGNRVIILYKQGHEYSQKEYKLKNYYASFEFTENELKEDEHLFILCKNVVSSFVDVAANKIREQNIKMFGGESFLDLPLTEKNKYTCHQLCDWTWLEDDNGEILRATKNEEGETVYKATLVKYAIILDKNNSVVENEN